MERIDVLIRGKLIRKKHKYGGEGLKLLWGANVQYPATTEELPGTIGTAIR